MIPIVSPTDDRIDAPGLYRIAPEQYHGDPCRPLSLSRSSSHTIITRSPAHARLEHARLGGQSCVDVTSAMDFGSLVHALVLGQGADIVVGDWDDWRTKAAREFREECREDGKIPVLLKDHTRAEKAAFAVRDHLDRNDMERVFRDRTNNELTAVWREGTAWLRCMMDSLDCFEDGADIWDLKTTTVAHPADVARKCAQMGYALQDAFYTRGVEALHPELAGRVNFRFVWVETTEPFGVCVTELDAEAKAIGRSQFNRALELWQTCIKTDTWPGYPSGVVRVNLPAWALYAEAAEAGGEISW